MVDGCWFAVLLLVCWSCYYHFGFALFFGFYVGLNTVYCLPVKVAFNVVYLRHFVFMVLLLIRCVVCFDGGLFIVGIAFWWVCRYYCNCYYAGLLIGLLFSDPLLGGLPLEFGVFQFRLVYCEFC